MKVVLLSLYLLPHINLLFEVLNQITIQVHIYFRFECWMPNAFISSNQALLNDTQPNTLASRYSTIFFCRSRCEIYRKIINSMIYVCNIIRTHNVYEWCVNVYIMCVIHGWELDVSYKSSIVCVSDENCSSDSTKLNARWPYIPMLSPIRPFQGEEQKKKCKEKAVESNMNKYPHANWILAC